MASISANQGWFTIKIEGGPDFGVYSLCGCEKLNEPFEFELELVSRDSEVDLVDLLGRLAFLVIADHGGLRRKVHGCIKEAHQLHTANSFTHYKIWLVPRLWFLGQNQNHRIFQHKSVVQIIDEILKEQKFLAQHVIWQLDEQYQPREYCVQYAESDLYFICRLCEEEGIYFYHDHKEDGHYLCFSDASGGPWIPDEQEGNLRFFPGSGQKADHAVISRLDLKRRINSDEASYQEWNFDQPPLNLSVLSSEPDQKKAPTPDGLRLETYKFPHLYDQESPGEHYAKIQLGRQLNFTKWVAGQSDVSRLLPGFAFKLHGHSSPQFNSSWWLTEVLHYGEQPQVLEHESPDRGFVYRNDFVAIPFETRFIPEISHPKKCVNGLQSAIVTGPGGEEVHVDQYGRVKVHFHWDRLGPMTEHSSCWLRVADFWAGQDFGSIQAPRIGQEVLVEFMEGDPDRPVVTRRVYNADNMPPWNLPSQKTLSGIQSREFKGAKRNQAVFDDTAGQVQAQLSSDHELSQLNIGHLTRLNHGEGRKDFRGEGFELRTDAWGSIRAARGLFVSTDAREKAASHQKDLLEAVKQITDSVKRHQSRVNQAAKHQAQPDEPMETQNSLGGQLTDIRGDGQMEQLARAQIVLSSPAGIALNTPQSIHIAAGADVGMTSGDNISLGVGKNMVGSALRRVSFFAQSAGMKLFAGGGKVEIQAQSDDMEIIADKVLNMISSQAKIHISAPDEILLTAGGSYLQTNADGVEFGSDKPFVSYAATTQFMGPKTIPYLEVPLPSSTCLKLATESSLGIIE